jgi:hypothetical protein
MIGTNSSALSWPLVAMLLGILAGASFLGYDHILSAGFVGTIYGAVLATAGVGHFATTGIGNGNG